MPNSPSITVHSGVDPEKKTLGQPGFEGRWDENVATPVEKISQEDAPAVPIDRRGDNLLQCVRSEFTVILDLGIMQKYAQKYRNVLKEKASN